MNARRPMLRLVRDCPDECCEPNPAAQQPSLGDHVLNALDDVSRRMEDLAKELHCLGYFDDDDRPRAA